MVLIVHNLYVRDPVRRSFYGPLTGRLVLEDWDGVSSSMRFLTSEVLGREIDSISLALRRRLWTRVLMRSGGYGTPGPVHGLRVLVSPTESTTEGRGMIWVKVYGQTNRLGFNDVVGNAFPSTLLHRKSKDRSQYVCPCDPSANQCKSPPLPRPVVGLLDQGPHLDLLGPKLGLDSTSKVGGVRR